MSDYSIFILQEGDISLSGGAQLDGVTQGDGSHLEGETITLNTNAYIEVPINDSDGDFQDNDNGQTLASDVTIDGVTFTSGDVVEAEYSFTVTDGTDTWTLIGFNVRNSSPSYGTVEGVAFIGPQGGFPPTGVPLTITDAQEGPNFDADDYAFPICFAAGTRIATPRGEMLVEALQPGDLVLTADAGPQPLIWTGASDQSAAGRFAPVAFEAGSVLGNRRPLWVSQQHRMRRSGPAVELLFGAPHVLVPARAFLGQPGVHLRQGGRVRYVHLMLAEHRILLAEGAAAESFYPGVAALDALSPSARREVLALLTERGGLPDRYGPTIDPCLGLRESAALLAYEGQPTRLRAVG